MASSMNNKSEMMKALGDDLNCPVCHNQLTPPVVQCENGHNTCPKCKPGCQSCPLCQGSFLTTPNKVLDKMLSLLANNDPCPYTKAGCPSLSSDEEHRQSCEFRSMSCPSERCQETLRARHFLSHVDELHFNRGVVLENKPFKLNATSFKNYFFCGCALRVNGNQYYFNLKFTRKTYSSKTSEIFYTLSAGYVPFNKVNDKHLFHISIEDGNDSVLDSLVLQPGIDNGEGVNISIPGSWIEDKPDHVVTITAMTT